MYWELSRRNSKTYNYIKNELCACQSLMCTPLMEDRLRKFLSGFMPASVLVTLLSATRSPEAMSIFPHTYVLVGGLCGNERADSRWSGHKISKQTRCVGLMLREDVARLKQERRRRLKFSLLVFFICFIAFFFCIYESPHLRFRV